MRISIGCDHGAVNHKQQVVDILNELKHQVVDYGTNSSSSVDYPDYAFPVAADVARGDSQYGIVLCTTGIGVSIVANKVDGVRCALCHNADCASLTRMHNDSNVLALGAKYVPLKDLKEIVNTFLNTPFEGGRHCARVEKVMAVESKQI